MGYESLTHGNTGNGSRYHTVKNAYSTNCTKYVDRSCSKSATKENYTCTSDCMKNCTGCGKSGVKDVAKCIATALSMGEIAAECGAECGFTC